MLCDEHIKVNNWISPRQHKTMYGSTSDSMNWDSMLDGTLDSLMNNSTEEEEDGNGDQITTGQFPPPSPKGMQFFVIVVVSCCTIVPL